MAHSNLKGHRKLRSLCHELSISEQLAVGLLQHWWWDVQAIHAVEPDGLLVGWENRTVAASAGWDGDADRFAQALRTAGFLETNTRNKVVVHDWADWAPRFVLRRWTKRGWSQDANGKWRKELRRRKQGTPGHTQVHPRAPPGNRGHLTRPDPTRPDRTKRKSPGPVDSSTDARPREIESQPLIGPEVTSGDFAGSDRASRAQRDKFRSLFAAKVCIALGLNGAAAQQQRRSLYAVARRIEDRADTESLATRLIAIAAEKRDAGLDKPIAAWQKEVNGMLGKG